MTTAAQTFDQVEAEVDYLNTHGSDLDPQFTLASPDPGVQGTLKVWTANGRLSPSLLSNIQATHLDAVALRAHLSRNQIGQIEADALAASHNHQRFGSSRLLGVAVDYVGPVRLLVDKVSESGASQLRARYSHFGSAAVLIEARRTDSLFYTRQADTSPFSGGTWIGSAVYHGVALDCSSGFGALSTNGSKYIVTAAHCYNPEDPREWTGAQFMGSVTNSNVQWDLAAIKVVDEDHSMYTGPYNSTNLSNVVIADSQKAGNNVGMPICTSGAYSGWRCNRATIGGYSHYGPWCTEITNLCTADLVLWYSNQTAVQNELAGEGDSGGPVVLDPATSDGRYHAIGLIHGPNLTGPVYYTPCVGLNYNGRTCSNGISFNDIGQIAINWQLNFTK